MQRRFTVPRKPGLRAVKPGEANVAVDDHRELLVAMRERISQAVFDPSCPPRDLASLTRRLADIAKEISAIDLRARQEAAEDADVAADEAWDSSAI
jgi:hypothetical protein